jgi:hypothetical protein
MSQAAHLYGVLQTAIEYGVLQTAIESMTLLPVVFWRIRKRERTIVFMCERGVFTGTRSMTGALACALFLSRRWHCALHRLPGLRGRRIDTNLK